MRSAKIVLAVLCLGTFAASCLSQTIPTFAQKTSSGGINSQGNFGIDVNGDGVTDVVQMTSATNGSSTFTVELANGDGTFKAPVVTSLPGSAGTTSPVSADFNRDGKIDLAFADLYSTQVLIYLGNGDGTFQSPLAIPTTLSSGFQILGPMVATDLNRDGKIDLAFAASNSTNSQIYALPGDGTGHFGAARLTYTLPGSFPDFLLTGDFDGDAIADLAYSTTSAGCNPTCHVTVRVLYGNGDFTFQDSTVFTGINGVTFLPWAAGDVNSDGKTDLFGTYNNQLVVLYGSSSGTFSQYTTPISQLYYTTPPALADFNGDGRMDLANMAEPTSSNPGGNLVFFLQSSSGGFTPYTYSAPARSGVAVGNFNRDTKPDVVLNSTSSLLYDLQNTTASGNWGGCTYPATSEGFNVCSPGSTTPSPVRFNAAANSFGPLRKIELWADGTKVGEQYHVWENWGWFDLSSGLPAGTRNVTFILVDTDDRVLKKAFSTQVTGNPCPVPTSPVVNVCIPGNNITVSSPVEVTASANVNGTLARMEIWVDGVKKFTESTQPYLDQSVNLASGYHRFDIYGVNTAGGKYEKTVYATVR